jgi:hypothetical protein
MKRAPSKKGIERRKRPRSAPKKAMANVAAPETDPQPIAPTAPTGAELATELHENCQNCGKLLAGEDRALFVEEEIGRIFCSETCITSYFSTEIERLEKEYRKRSSASDLTAEEKESYAHLRWITLQEPDEIWREKTLSGDFRYTLISEFQPNSKKIWCICICLFLKGEPSFLFLAFTTRNQAMTQAYQRGERVEWVKPQAEKPGSVEAPARSDRLADEWTDDETFLAEVSQERGDHDISPDEFKSYEKCLEETLDAPDEVWSCQLGEPAITLYHFLRYYAPELSDEQGVGHWYVVVARETEEQEQIEVLDAFPTRDSALVNRYRRGEQEVGHTSPGPVGRIIH